MYENRRCHVHGHALNGLGGESRFLSLCSNNHYVLRTLWVRLACAWVRLGPTEDDIAMRTENTCQYAATVEALTTKGF